MKTRLLFALSFVALLASCGGQKGSDATEGPLSQSDTTEVRMVECVASGDVVYVDLDYIMASSKLYATEGVALEGRMSEFQERVTAAQNRWAQSQQQIANEYNSLQNEFAQLQDNYSRGLITTLNAQQRESELQERGTSIQTRMTSLESTMQTEGQGFQTEEQALAEEQMVLVNRFQALVELALDDINGDNRYKMILNAISVVDSDPTLNISDLVLAKIDELYEAGALE